MSTDSAAQSEICVRLWRRLHCDDSGTVAMSLPVGILFFVVVAGFIFNAGRTIGGKIETQNAVDSATYSTSVVVARGMNAITASNHLIGELNALFIIHHSFGGKWLDENDPGQANNTSELKSANKALQVAFKLAEQSRPIKAPKAPYDKVKENPSADINSTIYEAKLRLKIVLTVAYGVHTAGWLLYEAGEKLLGTPAAVAGAAMMAAGLIMQAAALATELAVMKEYLVLTGIEKLAHGLKGFKKGIPTVIVAIHKVYQRAAYEGIPVMAVNAGNKMAKRLDAIPIPDSLVASGVAQMLPDFPIEHETTTNDERSQMMRASYPWVAYWRHNINKVLKNPFHIFGVPISGAAGYYTDWTNTYSKQTCEWLRVDSMVKKELTVVNFGKQSGSGEQGKDLHLYVLKGLNETNGGTSKSQEIWNDWDKRRQASSKIDQLFCHVGFVRSEKPKISVKSIFRQENPDGIVCYAQSMIYNANPQQRSAPSGGGGAPQPQAGWDTLGWVGNAIEYPGNLSGRPKIKLNWQAKLTPVTPEKLLTKSQVLLVDEHVRRAFWGSRESILILNNH